MPKTQEVFSAPVRCIQPVKRASGRAHAIALLGASRDP